MEQRKCINQRKRKEKEEENIKREFIGGLIVEIIQIKSLNLQKMTIAKVSYLIFMKK